MKFLRLILMMISFLALPYLSQAQMNTDTDTFNTGSFPIVEIDEPADPDDQIKRVKKQNQEESELDSFGEDEFNQNIDPDVLNDNDISQ